MGKTSSESSGTDSEEDRRKRDEFAERLKRKDKERTRNIITSRSDKKAYEEAAKRLKLENENRDKLIPRLRIESRRKYLEKRKDDKVAELEADLIDDEYLFTEQELTERERKDREHKKKLLELAKEHEKARELERIQRYHMPQDSKDSKDHYEEFDEREKVPHYEQRKWEEEQMSSAVFHFGAKQREQQEEYDLVMDNQIEFIQALQLSGNRDKEAQALFLEWMLFWGTYSTRACVTFTFCVLPVEHL